MLETILPVDPLAKRSRTNAVAVMTMSPLMMLQLQQLLRPPPPPPPPMHVSAASLVVYYAPSWPFTAVFF
jgi:hypothetical protein